jgi:hydrogenase expression/formation protein HypD
MKYLDEFRDSQKCRRLLDRILARCSRKWTIMEVCGGQTHGLLRYGIEEALRDRIEMIHGPGCPVCVTSATALDQAIEFSFQTDTLLVCFGDMLRVPGSSISLAQAKTLGGNVKTVYSPLDAVKIAAAEPSKKIIFMAVGFETTVPATAVAILQAAKHQLRNFFVLLSHVRVTPAMEHILQQGDCRIDGFLAAGHVCTVVGTQECISLSERYQVPIVVTGFEPLDLLVGIDQCVMLLEKKLSSVSNSYSRVVLESGNERAQDCMREVFEVSDQDWRGLGLVPRGGYRLREKYEMFNAVQTTATDVASHKRTCRDFASIEQKLFDRTLVVLKNSILCRSGDVLMGRIKPQACPHFGKECTPQTPCGAPMVSSEGACAAYFQYDRRESDLAME